MLRQIDAYTSAGLVVTGLAQVAPRVGLQAGRIDELWFMGAGLALCILGVLNLVRISARMPVVALICAVTNVVGSLYLLNVARVLPTPLVLLVLALALIATLCSLAPHVRPSPRV